MLSLGAIFRANPTSLRATCFRSIIFSRLLPSSVVSSGTLSAIEMVMSEWSSVRVGTLMCPLFRFQLISLNSNFSPLYSNRIASIRSSVLTFVFVRIAWFTFTSPFNNGQNCTSTSNSSASSTVILISSAKGSFAFCLLPFAIIFTFPIERSSGNFRSTRSTLTSIPVSLLR